MNNGFAVMSNGNFLPLIGFHSTSTNYVFLCLENIYNLYTISINSANLQLNSTLYFSLSK
jgi:hypothetical protein